MTPEKKEIKLEEYRPAAAPPAPVVQSVPVARIAENVPSHLPKTGSDLPLVGLVGIAALGSAAALRFVRRHA